ncbi:hypothetical protein [Thermanaeromonas toyohensis]|uniref:hypothetical protein n=1 Tax=Thermanaeromonas toyohensis TaxID=161154 RepID=UPI001E65B355|nr:hypothetical protein [Thermanaeromonas toyohensis]
MKRLRKLARVIKTLTPDEFRYLKAWLLNVIRPKLPVDAQVKLENILSVSYPWEVEKMISNLELVLEEMQREAWLKGLEKGKLEGELEGERKAKLQVAKNLLLLNVDVDTIAKATGFSLEEIEDLRKQTEH